MMTKEELRELTEEAMKKKNLYDEKRREALTKKNIKKIQKWMTKAAKRGLPCVYFSGSYQLDIKKFFTEKGFYCEFCKNGFEDALKISWREE